MNGTQSLQVGDFVRVKPDIDGIVHLSGKWGVITSILPEYEYGKSIYVIDLASGGSLKVTDPLRKLDKV